LLISLVVNHSTAQRFNVIAQNITDFKLLVLWSMDIFFCDERAYTVMHAKDAAKGGRSATEEMPYSLNLAIST